MVEKYQAWRSADGELFDSEQEAKDHEFTVTLATWFKARFPDPGVDGEPGTAFWNAMLEDRMKLLPIFKLLNGGSTLTAPTPQPERPSAEVIGITR